MNDRILVVYYSFEGNVRCVAEQLEKLCGAALERLQPDHEPPRSGPGKFLRGGYSALRKEKVYLAPLQADPAAFSRVVLACPVWAGTCPPAMKAFLDQKPFAPGTDVWLIGASMSGNAEKMLSGLKALLPDANVRGTLSLISPARDVDKTARELKRFCEEQGLD